MLRIKTEQSERHFWRESIQKQNIFDYWLVLAFTDLLEQNNKILYSETYPKFGTVLMLVRSAFESLKGAMDESINHGELYNYSGYHSELQRRISLGFWYQRIKN